MGTKTVHKSEKVSKQVEKKPRASSQLSDGAKALLAERRHVVNQWRGRRISPELAVARLSDLAHIDDDGTAWRLLPRPDGVALVKTGVDGEAVVIDPPAKYPLWPAITGTVILVALLAFALWSSFAPVTGGTNRVDITLPATSISGDVSPSTVPVLP